MTINIDYEAEKKLELSWEEILKDIICASLDFEKCPYEAEVNVVLTDNLGIQEINQQCRGIDSPTDVLSFPMVEYDSLADCFNPETGELLLGDIMISVDKVEEQAEKYGHSQTRELAFLAAHSMLHLLGYDHMEDSERLIMEEKQSQILESRGYTR